MGGQHQAAVIPQKGSRFSVVSRATPEPGPDDILIQVKAVAVNPVDYAQRDLGFPPVPQYPAIVGSDVAGLVVKTGSNVSDALPSGSRVIALASSFYQGGSPDYGGFQQYVLAKPEGVIALPENLSFQQGALFPLAVLSGLSSWTTIGIPIDTRVNPQEKRAVLIWGGSSSVGTFVVQSAKEMGFVVFTTAGVNNHEYLKTLGADHVFDYKADDVISQITGAVKENGVILKTAVCAAPETLQPTLDVLQHTKGNESASVAHLPPLSPDHPTLEGVEIKFSFPPSEPAERREHVRKCFHDWLQNGLKAGTVVPSPRIKLEEGGLEGLNSALDRLKTGVSGTKIVVEL